MSLKAGNGGAPHGDTSPRGSRRVLSGRTLRGGLQTGFQPVACSLCADGVRRYSARINAFILLPLYYSGAVQGSQGTTKNDSECPPRCFGHPQRKNYFKFRDIGTPAGVPISHFHNRVFGKQKEPHPGSRVRFSLCRDQAVSSTLFLPASSFCLKRPLALKPGMEVDSSWLETLVLGLV
mgnify:CR=1 FL=1